MRQVWVVLHHQLHGLHHRDVVSPIMRPHPPVPILSLFRSLSLHRLHLRHFHNLIERDVDDQHIVSPGNEIRLISVRDVINVLVVGRGAYAECDCLRGALCECHWRMA